MSSNQKEALAELNMLRSCPKVAWPTIALFCVCITIIGFVWYAAIALGLPLWAGTVINGVTAYYLFSAVHDSSHNSVSKNKRLNEIVGRIGLVYFAPLAPLDVARYIHMSHHKNTNDPILDPDHFAHKIDFWFMLRWLNFDFYYLKWFVQSGGNYAKRKYPAVVAYIACVLLLSAGIIWAGYGMELLMLWVLSTRITSLLFVLVFIILPHHPFEVTAKEDEYKATALRLGSEWILTPLMAFHNYHLIHHLYPTAPFYNYRKILNLRREEILAREPLMPPAFGLAASSRA